MKELKQFGFTILNFLFLVISTTFIFSLTMPYILSPSLTLPILLMIYFVPFIWAIVEFFVFNQKKAKKTFNIEIFISTVFSQIFLMALGIVFVSAAL